MFQKNLLSRPSAHRDGASRMLIFSHCDFVKSVPKSFSTVGRVIIHCPGGESSNVLPFQIVFSNSTSTRVPVLKRAFPSLKTGAIRWKLNKFEKAICVEVDYIGKSDLLSDSSTDFNKFTMAQNQLPTCTVTHTWRSNN